MEVKKGSNSLSENPPKEQDEAHLSSPRDHDHSDSDSTATNSSDFNWDEDEEDVGRAGTEKAKAKRGRAVYLAFMKLARPVRVFLLGFLGCALCIAPLLIVQFLFKETTMYPHVFMWSLWISIIWVAGCLTYVLVDGIPRMVISLVVLFGGQVERLKIQLELTLAVSPWLKLALDISWGWIALSVLRHVYKPPGNYWTIVNRVMQALFSAGVIFLVEKLFLQFVAINFHEKALADRLAENRIGLRALDRLSNATPVVTARRPNARRGHKGPGDSVDFTLLAIPKTPRDGTSSMDQSPSDSHAHHKKNARADKKSRQKAVTSVIIDQLSGAIGQVALKNSRFNREADVGGLHSARRLARKLFSTLSDVHPPRSHLIVEDFYPYFRSTAEAHEAFRVFDKDGNGDISKREMRDAVQRIYRERKALVASLKDVGSAVAKLDAVLAVLALLIIVFVCLLIFSRNNTLASLVPLATVVLGFSFIFGRSAQTLFESLIFIFSTHVFDVGDLVIIDDQTLEVKEFGLFSTTFRRVDGQEIVAPNALLANAKTIHNLRRSGSMFETTTIMVSYKTPLETIEELKGRVNQYVADNSREWASAAVNIDKMEYQNAIHLIIAMEHRPNWQDWGARWARRTAFMRNLKCVLEDLDIRYTMPVQPVLMPRGGFGGGGGPNPSSSIPLGTTPTSGPMLGNAGSFQGSDHLRAPGRGFRTDVGPL
ncbi:hypothetical protein E1B28_007527 [Marasmius oreades]|uniref:EF-hand domain-containing protein n=1 Tax=Marasmius oreades TaxID=181124 RepID=A0A9P7UTV5_9AGAR|nr:uncharacterized protein E1B28_007527 [Marasmius oreades]KAG7093888.1 hypothetical protein E1B28_007527 [Marasmius oreades]